MPDATDSLPLASTLAPSQVSEVAGAVAEAARSKQPVYPIGGGTSLNYGLAPSREGLGLRLTELDRVVDYPARDMTITVEAGIKMHALAEKLRAENQRFPVDVPQAERATLGGVIATNTNGALRYAQGTVRDYVIGIEAVDGHGTLFHGGGRVVKNVAGYDFCKLLTGSLGTLAIITQVTLRLKPLPPASAFFFVDLPELVMAESLLEKLVTSNVYPAAIELLAGPAWEEDAALGAALAGAACRLLVGLEGTRVEVDWMLETLRAEWQQAGQPHGRQVPAAEVPALWTRLAEFPAEGDCPLGLKISALPSATVRLMQLIREIDAAASIMAHAGDGVIIARFSKFAAEDVSRVLVGLIQPAVAACGVPGANVVALSHTMESGWTRRAQWGTLDRDLDVMRAIKRQFDPQGILNPGRFVYD